MSYKISVIIPCYNLASYLGEALNSVRNQTYQNWECIIIDDGSKDETENIAEDMMRSDNRFKYVYQENQGVCLARNNGINLSSGDLILALDADDFISKDYMELAVAEFNRKPRSKVVYCKAERIGSRKGEWDLKSFSLNNLAKENLIFCSAFFWKKDWEEIGGYDPEMTYGLEDWEFWINLLKNGGEVVQLDKICFFYRIREGSRNISLDGEKMILCHNYLNLKHADFFIKYLGSSIDLYRKLDRKEKEIAALKKSEKLAINILVDSIFGRKFWKERKQES